jgi:hypothetical protein
MYYPKSQITTNLYTNGDELYYESSKELYRGYYWKTSTGEFFTGKNPQDRPSLKLVQYRSDLSSGFKETNDYIRYIRESEMMDAYSIIYNDINRDFSTGEYPLYKEEKKILPMYSPNLPTESDYRVGEYRRYFCKKTNELIYIEIDKKYYNKLLGSSETVAYEYYTPFNIPWRLTGDKEQVYKVNKNIVELTMNRRKLFMFDKYLKEDYLKYYI